MPHRFDRPETMDLDDFEELLADMPHDQRWELIGGRVTKMMVGARWEHHLITQNLAFGLRRRLDEQRARWMVFTETFYVKSASTRSATLPDVVVRCGAMEPGAIALDDPKVIVEVVSPGSESRDRVAKWSAYRRLASLDYYVLVERDRAAIDVFDRAGEFWASDRTVEGLDAVLDLPALGLALPLDEIYRGVPTA